MTAGISFSILTHNRASMLRGLVDVLHAEAASIAGDYEIIVVDDASTDPDAVALLLEYETSSRVRVLRKDHELQMPESWARNVSRGLAASRYDIVWHFDDDTRIEGEAGWSRHVARYLRSHPELGVLAPYRTGILEPFVSTPYGYFLSFGLTEPCFAMRRDVFDKVGPLDDDLRWFFGPDYALRIMDAGYECAFLKVARQLDLCVRTGMPVDTFPRADGKPFMKKWCDRYGVGEHAWPPYVRHRERLAGGSTPVQAQPQAQARETRGHSVKLRRSRRA